MPKKRFVKKGAAKSKGWRKTGKTRKRNGLIVSSKLVNGLWVVHLPPPKSVKQILPDQLYTSIEVSANYSIPVGTLLIGVDRYFTFASNQVFNPFTVQPSQTNGQLIIAALGGTPGTAAYHAMGGVVNPTDYQIAPFMSTLSTLQQEYQKQCCYKTDVLVDIHSYDIRDNYELVLLPCTGDLVVGVTTDQTFAMAKESKHSKYVENDDWAGTLPHHSLRDTRHTNFFFGEDLTVKEMMVGTTAAINKYTNSPGVNTVIPIGYQVHLRNRYNNGAANVGPLAVTIKLKQHLCLFEPRPFNIL